MNSQLYEIDDSSMDEFDRQCSETDELSGLINKLLVEKDRDLTVCLAALLDVLVVAVRKMRHDLPQVNWVKVCEQTIVRGLEEEQPQQHAH